VGKSDFQSPEPREIFIMMKLLKRIIFVFIWRKIWKLDSTEIEMLSVESNWELNYLANDLDENNLKVGFYANISGDRSKNS
jgi:hypothetical protein